VLAAHRDLHSFPTRRSSDLPVERTLLLPVATVLLAVLGTAAMVWSGGRRDATAAVTRLVREIARDSESAPLDPASARAVLRLLVDRKSTRLNSSHRTISYAV